MALIFTTGELVYLPCRNCYRLGLPTTVAKGEWQVRCHKCAEGHTITIEKREDGWRILIQSPRGGHTVLE